MLKRCPLDHRCMQLVTTEMVCAAVMELMKERAADLGSRVS
jgi:hypothetical protein